MCLPTTTCVTSPPYFPLFWLSFFPFLLSLAFASLFISLSFFLCLSLPFSLSLTHTHTHMHTRTHAHTHTHTHTHTLAGADPREGLTHSYPFDKQGEQNRACLDRKSTSLHPIN